MSFSKAVLPRFCLGQPRMDPDLYRQHFHLNDHEIELIAG